MQQQQSDTTWEGHDDFPSLYRVDVVSSYHIGSYRLHGHVGPMGLHRALSDFDTVMVSRERMGRRATRAIGEGIVIVIGFGNITLAIG